jgi:hypothetical protein
MNSVELLRDCRSTAQIRGLNVEGKILEFEPILNLIGEHLQRCNHSQKYIDEVLSNSIKNCAMAKPTKQTDIIWFELYNKEKVLFINLKQLDELPYWIYKKLENWDFDLTKL